MRGFMPNAATAGITGRPGRGCQNLYGPSAVERAWALAHKNAISNGE
nr:MAG TPA: hypothetical protein [Caudoviricetes sp.]